jgi:hypothetical protein
MNWLKRIFHPRTYYSDGKFALHLVPVIREGLRVEYRRGAVAHDLNAEYVGRRWGAVDIRIPADMPTEQLRCLVADLAIGLQAMRREYVINQTGTPVEVPQDQHDRAADRLRQMGFEPKVLIDNCVTLNRPQLGQRSCSPGDSLEIMNLLHAIRGRRAPIKELARSQGYERAIHES